MQNQVPGTNSWHISKQWVVGRGKQQLWAVAKKVFFFSLLLKIIKSKKNILLYTVCFSPNVLLMYLYFFSDGLMYPVIPSHYIKVISALKAK